MSDIQIAELKRLTKGLKKAGADRNQVRSWLKDAKQLTKKKPKYAQEYVEALGAQRRVERSAKDLEKVLILAGEEKLDATQKTRWENAVADLVACNREWIHPFLVAEDDREYQMVYEAVLRMGITAQSEKKERVLLQSEVENLLAMTGEILEHKMPDITAYCYFCMKHENKELLDLSPAERRKKITSIFETEYITEIQTMINQVLSGEQRQEALALIEQIGD